MVIKRLNLTIILRRRCTVELAKAESSLRLLPLSIDYRQNIIKITIKLFNAD